MKQGPASVLFWLSFLLWNSKKPWPHKQKFCNRISLTDLSFFLLMCQKSLVVDGQKLFFSVIYQLTALFHILLILLKAKNWKPLPLRGFELVDRLMHQTLSGMKALLRHLLGKAPTDSPALICQLPWWREPPGAEPWSCPGQLASESWSMWRSEDPASQPI